MYGILAAATFTVYLFVYRGEGVGGRMLYLSPGELGFQVGVAYMSSSRWIWMIATIAVLIGCSTLFVISLHSKSKSESDFAFNVFCNVSFLFSLPLTFLLAQAGGSQGYFLLSASVIAIIPSSKVIAEILMSREKIKISIRIVTVFSCCLIFSYCMVYLWNSTLLGIDPYRFSLIFKISTLIIPVLLYVLARILLKDSARNTGLLLLFVVFMLIGVFHRTSFAGSYFNSFSNHSKIEPISGSENRIDALTWLRNNSHEDDIVATNRYCIPYVEPCTKKWYLVAAISRRRLLIEGFGYGLPIGKGVSVASERMINSMEFGRKPNKHLWEYLDSFDVKWFVVDAAAGRVTDSWEPFATVVFQNSEMKILKLADHL
jgi:hypothetical protein